MTDTQPLHATHSVSQSPALRPLFSKLRATSTDYLEFRRVADRIHRILAEEGLAVLPHKQIEVATPCGTYSGLQGPDPAELCIVSIIRAGDSLLQAVMDICPHAAVGKVLIQRDANANPVHSYSKFPNDVDRRLVIIVDPMLATGGSAVCCIEKVLEAGVPQENILFLNVVSCPEGLKLLADKFPKIKVWTGEVDECLNEKKYIVPGCGDYGDRYFNTHHE